MSESQATLSQEHELTPKELELQNALLLLIKHAKKEGNLNYDPVSDIAYFGVSGRLLGRLENEKNN